MTYKIENEEAEEIVELHFRRHSNNTISIVGTRGGADWKIAEINEINDTICLNKTGCDQLGIHILHEER